jgi:sec-independent protein translocase protein TatB
MQFLGIGLPELLLILILTALVVGPERMPEVAAQLARWIRQAQAYANYVRQDFTQVIGDLEKEVGASREDLKTIAEVFRRDAGSVLDELNKAGQEFKDATDLQSAAGTNVIPLSGGNRQNGHSEDQPVDSTALKEAAMADAEANQSSEPRDQNANGANATNPEDWFKPTPSRRRRREDESA